MSKKSYFSSYKSPNIVIVPISNENMPPLKRAKIKDDDAENTQIYQKNNNTVIEANQTQTVSVQNNVMEQKNQKDKNVRLIDSECNKHKKMKEIAQQISKKSNIKIENKAKVKSKIKHSDSLKTSKKCDKGKLSIVNGSNTINLIDDTKVKNNTEDKHSSPEENESGLKPNCGQSEILKSELQNGTINKINSNVNLKLPSKKSNLCRQTKSKVDRHKMKSKKQKIIKIVINVTYNNLHEKDNAKIMTESEYDKNPDLSFLDDFDVDEVVESLLSCENTNKNTKEYINERIQVKDDIYNTLKKSSAILTEEKKKLRLTKNAKNPTENTSKEIKHEKQHILEDFGKDNLCKVSHVNNKSLEKVINKIKVNDQKKYKKVVKILEPNISNVTETKINSTESKLRGTKPSKNKLMVCKNTISTKELSKDFSNSDSYNIPVKEAKNVINVVKEEKITNKVCLMKKNKYYIDELSCQNLEIKMCNLTKEKCSVNTVAHCGKFSKILKCTSIVSGKFHAIKMLNGKFDYNKGIRLKTILQKVQQEIPRENLFCILLMHSFLLNHQWCFVTHYYPFNLQQVLQNERKSFHIDKICNLSMQLVLALIVLRNKYIVHSDIKPSHILLDSDMKELKLCGFDEAYDYYCSKYPSPNVGTVNYRAPERILGYSNGFSIDIWSLALVMYEMVTGRMLFSGETDNEILYKQISVFGNLPNSMVMESKFKKDHFIGTNFVRHGYCGQEDNINNFANAGGIKKTVIDAYEKHWDEINTENKIFKLNSLCRLLEKMLILNPNHRLPVEYVYANPFFSAK